MDRFTVFLLLLSATMFVFSAIITMIKSKNVKFFLCEFLGIVVFLFIINLFFDLLNPLEYGGLKDWLPTIIMFGFILLGMLSNHFFNYLDKPPGTDFNWRLFWRPFFISPLILFVVSSLIPDTDENLFNKRNLTIWLVGFQNGFFWASVYDKFKNKIIKQNSATESTVSDSDDK